MKTITVRRISLKDYATLTEAGYKINFAMPDREVFAAQIKSARSVSVTSTEHEIRCHVSLSTRIPYARIKDRK